MKKKELMDAQLNKKTNILLVEDGLGNSYWAAQHLIELTHPEWANIHVIQILPERKHPIVRTLYMGGMRELHPAALTEKELATITAEEEREGYLILDRTCKLIHEYGLESISVLRSGVAINEIVRYAKEEEIELIVVGACKPKNIRTWRTYNFIRKLMKNSNCPVLIVNSPWQLESLGSTGVDLSKKEFQT
jgi:nucleotide-binding universal stress UspA family protein